MNNSYDQAIDAIVKGAERLKAVCDSDDENAVYQELDGESTFSQVPVGAFCLKLAYKVWQDLQQEARMVDTPRGFGALMGTLGNPLGKKTAGPEQTAE